MFLVLSLPLLSCTKPINDLEMKSPTEISFTKGGGTSTVSFTAYSDWTAKCDASWIQLSPASGTADIDGVESSVKVTASANPDYDERSATISIVSNEKTYTVSVKQDQKTAVILSESEQTVDYTAGTLTITGKANVERKVEISSSCSGWITYTPSKALSSFDITLNIAENDSDLQRKGEVYVRSTDSEVGDTVTVIQKGKPAILFCENPGIYQSRLMKCGYKEYTSQLGFFSRVAGTNEFQIVNASSRKYCLFRDMVPVGEKAPESPFTVNVIQNMTSSLKSELSLSLTIYRYEDGYIWAQDEEQNYGVIIKVK